MRKLISLVLLTLVLQGCASVKSNPSMPYVADSEAKIAITVNKHDDVDMPEGQLEKIEEQIQQGLTQQGILAAKNEKNVHSAVITITSFRMREDADRLLVGIMAGCDNIDSLVTVRDEANNQALGKAELSITECGGWGVADQVIGKYCEGVVEFLAGED